MHSGLTLRVDTKAKFSALTKFCKKIKGYCLARGVRDNFARKDRI